jgi:hypothetical protein
LAAFLTKVPLGVPVLVLLAWVCRWIVLYYTVYIVTDLRIVEIKQKGIFDREVEQW